MYEPDKYFLVDMLEALTQAFSGQLMMLAGLYTMIFIVVLLDLWSGIRKARQRGEYRSSYGLRKTVEKLAKYFNMMLVLSVIDAMQMLAVYDLNPQISFRIPIFPILTVAGAIFVGIIELKSIYEKADQKDKGKYQDAARLVKEFASNKEARSIINSIAEYLKKDNDDK